MKRILFTILTLLLFVNISYGQKILARYEPNTSEVIKDGEHKGLTRFVFRAGVPTTVTKQNNSLFFTTTDDTIEIELEGKMADVCQVSSSGKAFLLKYSGLETKKYKYNFTKNKHKRILETDNRILFTNGKNRAKFAIGRLFYNKNGQKISPNDKKVNIDSVDMSFDEDVSYTMTDTFYFDNIDNIEDVHLYSGQPNQEGFGYLYAGKINGLGQIPLLRFTSLKDSNIATVVAGSLYLKMRETCSDDLDSIHFFAMKKAWVVDQATYADYATATAWGDSGARGSADIYLEDSESDVANYDVVSWGVNTWRGFIVTNCIQTIVDNADADESIRMFCSNINTAIQRERANFYDESVSGGEPYLVVISEPATTTARTGITPEVRAGTIIKAVENGEITKEVYP